MMLCLIIKPSHLSGPDRMCHSNSFGRCRCFHLHTALEHVTSEVRTVGHISGADQKRGLSLLAASLGTTVSAEKDSTAAVSRLEEPSNLVFILSRHLAAGFSMNPGVCRPRLLQRIRVDTLYDSCVNLKGVVMAINSKHFLNDRLHGRLWA